MSAPWPPAVEVIKLTMRFGDFTALDDVSLRIQENRVHALLGENGAGKSTLVKCLIGYQTPSDGQICVMNEEVAFQSPMEAHAKGLGMVFQHFNLVDNMSVAENLLLSLPQVPARIRWDKVKKDFGDFMAKAPFKLPLDARVGDLSAGEKQKLEILKQLYLENQILILDEPTSVLTPDEADEVLGHLRKLVQAGKLTLILITHKFREVEAYADDVSVLRKGKLVASGEVGKLSRAELAASMVGQKLPPPLQRRPRPQNLEGQTVFAIRELVSERLKGFSASVGPGEILGIAGVSGNGQKDLVDVLCGLQPYTADELSVEGKPYRADFRFFEEASVSILPEMPLQNACVGQMTVADNLAFRFFGRPPFAQGPLMRHRIIRARAQELREEYHVACQSLDSPMQTLSGGNVQRAVLGRELSETARVLVVVNPCFGLDFLATSEIRQRILSARDAGTAVLLISEDLDEVLELSDRVAVMFEGRLVFETTASEAKPEVLGHYMAGGSHS